MVSRVVMMLGNEFHIQQLTDMVSCTYLYRLIKQQEKLAWHCTIHLLELKMCCVPVLQLTQHS